MRVKVVSAVLAAALAMGQAGAYSTSAFAQQASSAATDRAERVALAKRYFSLIKIDKQLEATMSAVMPMMTADLSKELDLDPASPEGRQIAALVGEISILSMADIMPKYLGAAAEIAADTFTREELAATVQFYETQVGRSLIEKSPQMAVPLANIMQTLLPEIEASMLTHMCARLDCEPPATPKGQGA